MTKTTTMMRSIILLVLTTAIPMVTAAPSRKTKIAAQTLIDALTAVANGEAEGVDKEELDDEIYELFGDNRMLKDKDFYADRYVQNMWDIVNDPDCMTNALDATSPDFTLDRAIEILTKCGLLMVKNAISKDILEPFKLNVTSYMKGLMDGRISTDGKTTYGEPYFIHETSTHRYDMLFPEELFNEDIMAHPLIIDIVSDDEVIGDNVVMLDSGAVVSEPGSKLQHWHGDGDIYENMFNTHGLAGFDLPPFSVGAMIPLLDTNIQHGPTEFCMGQNAIQRIQGMPDFRNETLREFYLMADSYLSDGDCPPSFLRTPLPQFGDVMFFYFNMMHRGGENVSPDVRTILYQSYSQHWFKDGNFNNDAVGFGSTPELQELFGNVRAAVPDYMKPADPTVTYQLDDLEKMGTFEPKGGQKAGTRISPMIEEEITVSNVDVELEDLTICVAHVQDHDECFDAPDPGEGIVVEAHHGEEVQVFHDSTLLKAWTIKGPEQLFVSYQYFDNCLWEDKCIKTGNGSGTGTATTTK
jgi:ectoine hydroxylase-related dioxygenase (phytanoyl-CoA dioxygenase family)